VKLDVLPTSVTWSYQFSAEEIHEDSWSSAHLSQVARGVGNTVDGSDESARALFILS
jgi:hypothetical protein